MRCGHSPRCLPSSALCLPEPVRACPAALDPGPSLSAAAVCVSAGSPPLWPCFRSRPGLQSRAGWTCAGAAIISIPALGQDVAFPSGENSSEESAREERPHPAAAHGKSPCHRVTVQQGELAARSSGAWTAVPTPSCPSPHPAQSFQLKIVRVATDLML